MLNTGAMAREGRGAARPRRTAGRSRARSRVETLPPGEKQLVEIARALGTDVRVLIMDEPTSSLTQNETERLYTVIDGLKAAGVSVLYISHRLAEVKRCADRVSRPARRAERGRTREGRDHPRQHGPADGRPRPEAVLPEGSPQRRPAASRCSSVAACAIAAGRTCPRRSKCGPARSSAWPGWSARPDRTIRSGVRRSRA